MEAPIYNKEGKPAGKIQLPEAVFGQRFNADLVHQVVVSLQANARHGTAHAKNRGGRKAPAARGTAPSVRRYGRAAGQRTGRARRKNTRRK